MISELYQETDQQIQLDCRNPEYINQIHNSNRLIKIDGKIREVINYLESYKNEIIIDKEIILTAIKKLYEI